MPHASALRDESAETSNEEVPPVPHAYLKEEVPTDEELVRRINSLKPAQREILTLLAEFAEPPTPAMFVRRRHTTETSAHASINGVYATIGLRLPREENGVTQDMRDEVVKYRHARIKVALKMKGIQPARKSPYRRCSIT